MSWDQAYDFGDQAGGFYGGSDANNYGYSAPPADGGKGGGTGGGYPSYMTPNSYGDPYGDPQNQGGPGIGNDDFQNEPPLLEELGIHPDHIVQKTLSVLNPMRQTSSDVAGDADLAGPLCFCLAFGALLLLCGKIHFNYIYGIGGLGSLAVYGLLTLMNVRNEVALAVVISVLGYCILPIVALSALGVIFSLQGVVGTVLSVTAVLWCSLSASKLFVTAFDMQQQQLLVAYPCSMLYALFALITVF